jgi:hypothetical protein
MRHNGYKYRSDRSIKKGTIPIVQSSFLEASRLLYMGFISKYKYITFGTFGTCGINVVPIGQ